MDILLRGGGMVLLVCGRAKGNTPEPLGLECKIPICPCMEAWRGAAEYYAERREGNVGLYIRMHASMRGFLSLLHYFRINHPSSGVSPKRAINEHPPALFPAHITPFTNAGPYFSATSSSLLSSAHHSHHCHQKTSRHRCWHCRS